MIVSSGAVAYSIITLLPVELILHIGSAAGYAMIFALLFAAVIWNLATWFVGLPNSSSHALIGSILELARLTDTPAPSIQAVYACVKLLNKVMLTEGGGLRLNKAA